MAIKTFDTSSSDHYQLSRPGYLPTVVDLAEAALGGRRKLRWLDVAAGTGALTAVVRSAGHKVTALEADSEMARVLRGHLPDVPVVLGRAERAATLVGQRFDVVSVAQALHYLNLERLVQQVRHLAPRGVFIVCSNRGDGTGWLGEISAEWIELSGQQPRDPVRSSSDAVSAYFGEPLALSTEPNRVVYTKDRAILFLESLSSFRQESREVQSAVLKRARELLLKYATGHGVLDMNFLQTTTVYAIS